jgi:DNA-directed RNA polymerase specialized sigma subunit
MQHGGYARLLPVPYLIRAERSGSGVLNESLSRYRKVLEDYYTKTGLQPTCEEVAKILGISVEEARQLQENFPSIMSSDIKQSLEEDEGSKITKKIQPPLRTKSFAKMSKKNKI